MGVAKIIKLNFVINICESTFKLIMKLLKSNNLLEILINKMEICLCDFVYNTLTIFKKITPRVHENSCLIANSDTFKLI